MPDLSEFTLQELRYMKLAQGYYNQGQTDQVAFSTVVKLMGFADVVIDDDFEDAIDRAIRVAEELHNGCCCGDC